MSENVTWENFCLSLSSFFLTHTHTNYTVAARKLWIIALLIDFLGRGGGREANEINFPSRQMQEGSHYWFPLLHFLQRFGSLHNQSTCISAQLFVWSSPPRSHTLTFPQLLNLSAITKTGFFIFCYVHSRFFCYRQASRKRISETTY